MRTTSVKEISDLAAELIKNDYNMPIDRLYEEVRQNKKPGKNPCKELVEEIDRQLPNAEDVFKEPFQEFVRAVAQHHFEYNLEEENQIYRDGELLDKHLLKLYISKILKKSCIAQETLDQFLLRHAHKEPAVHYALVYKNSFEDQRDNWALIWGIVANLAAKLGNVETAVDRFRFVIQNVVAETMCSVEPNIMNQVCLWDQWYWHKSQSPYLFSLMCYHVKQYQGQVCEVPILDLAHFSNEVELQDLVKQEKLPLNSKANPLPISSLKIEGDSWDLVRLTSPNVFSILSQDCQALEQLSIHCTKLFPQSGDGRWLEYESAFHDFMGWLASLPYLKSLNIAGSHFPNAFFVGLCKPSSQGSIAPILKLQNLNCAGAVVIDELDLECLFETIANNDLAQLEELNLSGMSLAPRHIKPMLLNFYQERIGKLRQLDLSKNENLNVEQLDLVFGTEKYLGKEGFYSAKSSLKAQEPRSIVEALREALRDSANVLSEKLDKLSTEIKNRANQAQVEISKQEAIRINKNDAATLLLSNCQEALEVRLETSRPDWEEIRSDILWIDYIHKRVLASIKRQEARRIFVQEANHFMEAENSFINQVKEAHRWAKKVLDENNGKFKKLKILGAKEKDRIEKVDRITRNIYLLERLSNHFEMRAEMKEKYQRIPQSIIPFLITAFLSEKFKTIQLRQLITLLYAQEELKDFFTQIMTVPGLILDAELKKNWSSIIINGFDFRQHPLRYERLLDNLRNNIKAHSQYEHPFYQPVDEEGNLMNSDDLVSRLTMTMKLMKKSMAEYARKDELSVFQKVIDNKIKLLTETTGMLTLFKQNDSNKQVISELTALKNKLYLNPEWADNDSAKGVVEAEQRECEYGAIIAIKHIVFYIEENKSLSKSTLLFCKELLKEAQEIMKLKAIDEAYTRNYMIFGDFIAQHLPSCAELGIQGKEELFFTKPMLPLNTDNNKMIETAADGFQKPNVPATDLLVNVIESVHSDGPSTIVSLSDVTIEHSLQQSFSDEADEIEMDRKILISLDPKKIYAIGNKYEQEMKYAQAEDEYYRLVVMAEQYRANGQHSEYRLGHYRLAYYRLARMYERGLSQHPRASEQVLDLYLQAASSDGQGPVDVYSALGRIYAKKEQYYLAKRYYNIAADKNCCLAQYALGCLYAEGKLKIQEAKDPESVAEGLYHNAICNAEQKLENAKKGNMAVDNLGEVEHACADAHYRIGQIREKENNLDLARISYAKSVAVKAGGYAPAYVRLGILCEGDKRYIEALSQYKAAVSVEHYEFHTFSAQNLSIETISPPVIKKDNIYIDFSVGLGMIIFSTGEIARIRLSQGIMEKQNRSQQLNVPNLKELILIELAANGCLQWGSAEAYERIGGLHGSAHPGISHDIRLAGLCYEKATKLRGTGYGSTDEEDNTVVLLSSLEENQVSLDSVSSQSATGSSSVHFWKSAPGYKPDQSEREIEPETISIAKH